MQHKKQIQKVKYRTYKPIYGKFTAKLQDAAHDTDF